MSFQTALLCLAATAFMLQSCRKNDGDNKPEPQPPVIDLAAKAKQCQAAGRSLDSGSMSCRAPVAEECFERNQVFSNNTCVDFVSMTTIAGKSGINFADLCEKNPAGALVNCKDKVYKLPIKRLNDSKFAPAWIKEATVDIEQPYSSQVEAFGEVKITFSDEEGTRSLLDPTDSEKRFITRDQQQGGTLNLSITFAPGTILASSSYFVFDDQLITVHDRNLILADIQAKKIEAAWLSEQTEEIDNAAQSRSQLKSDWLKFIKNEIPGQVIWDLRRDCPKDQIKPILTGVSCNEDIRIEIDPKWHNVPFVNTCVTIEPMLINQGSNPYGLYSYGRFSETDTNLTITKGTHFFDLCFVKLIE